MFKTLIVGDQDIFLAELNCLNIWGETSGFEIANQSNSRNHALELLREHSFDLVLTESGVPVTDGLQFLEEIKHDKLCPCVVIISEFSEFSYVRQGFIWGAFDYLVKPATEKSMLELLGRVTNYLEINQSLEASSMLYDWAYPSSEEKTLISYIINKDLDAISLFTITLHNLYAILKDNIIEADMIAKKFYLNIIKAVSEKYKWLDNFLKLQCFKGIHSVEEERNDLYKELYCRRISFLVHFIITYYPDTNDQNIKDVCEYILNNPEADLKLKTVSKIFYINNAYLSKTFATKTGLYYNDFVNMVKMARAEYLFRTSHLKTYEVGAQIGYRDNNYFLRQFKKTYGQNSTRYRSAAGCDDYQT
ncbi:MAG: AraC family transcriptional regulator [Paenibacillaceae bacterium]|jgi:two-component system response regulator YesN|nr:AraC family transcriptional regulator [Paenibacillaceae bacterium]